MGIRLKNKIGMTSIYRSLTLMLVLMVTILSGILITSGYLYLSIKSQTQFEEKAVASTKFLADSIKIPLWDFNTDVTKSISEAFYHDSDVFSLKVEDKKNVIFDQKKEKAGRFISKNLEINNGKDTIGRVQVSFYLPANKNLLTVVILLLLFIIGIILSMTGIVLKLLLKKPLDALMIQTKEIAAGNLEQAIDISRSDEIGVLARSFDNMRVAIRQKILEIETSHEQLETINQTLEQKVAERTLDLSDKNIELIKTIEELAEARRNAEAATEEIRVAKDRAEQMSDTLNEQVKEQAKARKAMLNIMEDLEAARKETEERNLQTKKLLDETQRQSDRLQAQMEELERFTKLTINREEKMIKLKEEVNALMTKIGKEAKYKIVE